MKTKILVCLMLASLLAVWGCSNDPKLNSPDLEPEDTAIMSLQKVSGTGIGNQPLSQKSGKSANLLEKFDLVNSSNSYQGGGNNYEFHLTSPSNNGWFEIGGDFKWTKFTPPSWITFWDYQLQIDSHNPDGTTAFFRESTVPGYDNSKTKLRVGSNDIPQGHFDWRVIARYTDGNGQLSVEEWAGKAYDVNIKGPSSAVPRNNQIWYVDEFSEWGPYSYVWNVYNPYSQKVAGPFTTTTLSINQIPASIAYGAYYIDLYVTFDKGTEHKTRLVTLD